MTPYTERSDYEETFDYVVPQILKDNDINSKDYGTYLSVHSRKAWKKHAIFHAHMPDNDYQPIPLTYQQWVHILKQLEIQLTMAEQVSVDVSPHELFGIAFAQQDPDHRKMSGIETNKYFMSL